MSHIKLNYLSAIQVSGKDAGAFLQAQLTADLTKLESGEACFSAFCRPNGNVLAVLLIIKHDDGYRLIAAAELMGDLLKELSRFVLRADVHFEELQDAVLGCSVLEENRSAGCVKTKSGTLVYCIADSHAGDSAPQEVEAWRLQELRSGLSWLNRDTADTFIPQMLGLEKLDALSFRKGCFPGQEVIARVRYLGKLKRRPVVVETSVRLEPAAGSQLQVLWNGEKESSAVVVDSVAGSEGSVLFLVARVPEGSQLHAIAIDERRIELIAPAQT